MATTLEHPQSPPRKRARLSLKLIRKDQQTASSAGSVETVEEEPGEMGEEEPSGSQCDTSSSGPQPVYPESSCIPSEYMVRVAPYTGLHNLGNTCYLNSVLQVLRYCPGFSENLERLSHMVGEMLRVKEEEDLDGEDERIRRRRREFIGQLRLVHKLNRLFGVMSEKEERYLSQMMPSGQELAMYPEDILDAIRDLNPMFKGYLQHDAQELLCCILSNVQEACQRLHELHQEPVGSQGQEEGMEAFAPSSSSEPCMKAMRKLDMGGAGDGGGGASNAGGEAMDCGKLLGGGLEICDKNVSRSSSEHCIRAMRKLEMGEASDGGGIAIKESLGCGRLLGGGRPGSDKTIPLRKPDCNGAKGQDNGFGGPLVSEDINGGMVNGDHKKRLLNGGTEAGKTKRGHRMSGHPGGISPSSDSVRRRRGRKGSLTNGHLSEKESCGMESNGCASEANGAGDCGSSNKKRLGMGRFVSTQSSILSKFSVIKKDKPFCEQNVHQNGGDASHCQDSRPATVVFDEAEKAKVTGEVIKSRNVTSNNSNSSEESLDTTQDSMQTDIETPKPDVKAEVECTKSSSKERTVEDRERMAAKSPQPDAAQTIGNQTKTTTSEISAKEEGTEREVMTRQEVAMEADMSEVRVVERLFQGTLVLQTRCLECEACSEKREDFQDVSVPVQSMPQFTPEEDEEQVADVNPKNLSLGWALSEFTSVERLTDDNKYYCEHCYHLTEAERSVLFGRLPGVLIIQLKRFSAFINCFSPGGSVSKVNDHLAIPLTLSLAKWCSSSCGQKDTAFELCAVVAHSGSSSSSGHYIAYSKVPRKASGSEPDQSSSAHQTQKESWANFDDDRVQVLSEEDFESVLNPLPGNDSPATPYLLFYRDAHHTGR